MKLLVDVGNSRVKWGWLDGTQLDGFGAVAHHGHALEAALTQAWKDAPQPESVIVSNVAGPMANHALNQICMTRFGQVPQYMVSGAVSAGIRSGYRDPARLGVDRWAALIGAFRRHGAPACVIDCGTAITLDAVTQDGRHLGGVIAPGIGAMRHALAGTGAEISEAPDTNDGNVFARDTHAAVTSGALNAVVGLIERVSTKMLAELGEGAHCLITGGDAEHLLSQLRPGYTLLPHLVLEGLAEMSACPPESVT
ncbi:MAG TPA: type III pantothenate kinase [Gammaproteobacteria bacterium]|nr:type III pantothenate kinase [Gammaproteobacteria bacterium]